MKIFCINQCFHGENWNGKNSGCRWPYISEGTINKSKLDERKDYYYQTFPFFLAFATAILREQGHDAQLRDYLAMNFSYEEMYREIEKEKPEKVIMESSIISYEQDLIIARNLNDFFGIKVVICGSAVKSKKEELKKLSFVSEVWEGNYIKSLLGGRDDYVDSLPMPFRDDNVLLYNDYFSFEKYIKKPQLQVCSSIGCPYNCTFCLWRWTITEGKYKRRPYEKVKEELEYCIKKWNFKSVLFDDDTFNVGDEHCKKISQMMRDNFKGIQWEAMVRADSCTLKGFEAMRKSGCMGLKVGVETFSPAILKKINKGLEAEDLFQRIIDLYEMGFMVYLSTMDFIFGETAEDREITNQYLQELYKMGIRYQRPMCLPLKGTKLYEEFSKWELKTYGDNIDDFEYGKYYDNKELQRRVKEYAICK